MRTGPDTAQGPSPAPGQPPRKRPQLGECLVVSFADAANNELPGVVSKIEGSKVTVDFNHPLAGRDLVFQVHILEVN